MAKVVKSVSFNDVNETDQQILAFIEQHNFSGYVKELILLDIERRNQKRRIVQRTHNGGIKIVINS